MNSVRVKVHSPHGIRKAHSEGALPLPLSSLLARIEELEARVRELEAPKAKSGAKVHANGKTNDKMSAMDPTTEVLVISSVVATIIDEPHRIVSMRPIQGSEGNTAAPWALHGRMHLHQMRS